MATGRIVIDVERCKGCDLCRNTCPQDVLAFADSLNSKGYRPVILLDPQHECTGCALCAVVCPDGCITVYRDLPTPTRATPPTLEKTQQQEVLRHAEAVA
jgi:2-oxoglutarate ferredoxin oxidoreductase subunit delta